MNTKQALVALALLIAGVVVFGFLASRATPVVPIPEAPQEVAASTYREDGPYLSITLEYPAAPQNVRAKIEQGMSGIAAQFKANANIEALTPEDIEFMGLGERKYALIAEYKKYTSTPPSAGEAPGYVSYAYTVYEDTLGAHPNTYFKTFVFDTQGNTAELGGLLSSNPNWLEELSLLVSNDVSAQYRARTGASDLTGLLYPEGLAPKVENFSNFVIDGTTLAILIPPYQVAAYAVGSFEVRTPLADLQ